MSSATVPKYSGGMGDPIDMLAEECSEVIKEVMKAHRFGLEGCIEWVNAGKSPPRDNIVQEIGDVLTIVDILLAKKFLTIDELGMAKAKKRERLLKLFGFEEVFGE